VRRIVGGAGRVLIVAGLLLLAFAGYQLWGTGLYESRAQDSLRSDFGRALATTTTTAPGSAPAVDLPPPTGEAVAVIRIPRIGVDRAVVQGVGRADLRKGPGHYPQTPLPGEIGNAAIAGHRTTYGAPFNRLDELQPGDRIEVRTLAGSYVYAVRDQVIVKPTDVSVIAATDTPTLTLTTCNPKYSAAQRLIVRADLLPDPSDAPRPAPAILDTAPPPTLADAQAPSDRGGAVLWGVIVLAAGLAWWWAFRRRRHWTTWILGFIPFAVLCFVWFGHLDRALPSGL
jgi:sortase A